MTAAPTRPATKVAALGLPTRLQHLRSGLFAFLFAPIALGLLAEAVTDSMSVTAVGQPLSSSLGMIGLLVATLLLGLIAVNADESPAGMVVTTAWSLVIAILQLTGIMALPVGPVPFVSGADMHAAMVWSLYPVTVFAICLGATLATFDVRRRALAAVNSPGPEVHLEGINDVFASNPTHGRDRLLVTVGSVILTSVAVAALIWAAPSDTLPVAAHGLAGLSSHHHLAPPAALMAAVCLGIVAWGSRRSLFGAAFCGVFLMAVPAYLILPLRSTLTGRVATPGDSSLTSLSLAAPVITALGLSLSALALGAHWTRRHLLEEAHRAMEAGADA